jgi:hypothetical protein
MQISHKTTANRTMVFTRELMCTLWQQTDYFRTGLGPLVGRTGHEVNPTREAQLDPYCTARSMKQSRT